MVFHFSKLPLELALEILQLAASTGSSANDQPRNRIYHTATSLALVSSNVRQVVMRHLLRTVILNSQETLNLFLRTLHQQKSFSSTGSRLSLDYTRHVRHLWSSQCWEPLADQPESHFINYRPFYDLFSRAETLGFNFKSIHLLYDALGDVRLGYLQHWNCTRVTFGGSRLRWNALTSTNSGVAFLREITHLTIWDPVNYGLSSPSHSDGGVPSWISKIPFKLMPKLTHFAFTLVGTRGSATTPVLVYTLPPSESSQGGGTSFLTWALSSDPIAFGSVVQLNVDQPMAGPIPDDSWELAYYRGENDIWQASN